jgi:hypothetical protein
MANQREINLAYYQGLQELSPEPEDAARDAIEMGIPYGEPVRDGHVSTGAHVAAIIASYSPSAEVPSEKNAAHDLWVTKLGLSAPSSEFPHGAPRATKEQKAAASIAVKHLKTLTHTTED